MCIRLGATLRDVHPDPAITGGSGVWFASGEVLYADLLTTDGVKSALQKIVTGLDNRPKLTGDATYHTIISTDLMLQDPEPRPFVETAEASVRMVPCRHLVGYCILSAKGFVGNIMRMCGICDNEYRRSTTWC